MDVAADCLFIFPLLMVLTINRVLPVLYGVFVLVNFLIFLQTSHYLKQFTAAFPASFVFDSVGKFSAAVFYLIPAFACIAYAHPPLLPALDVLLYISVLLAAISMAKRLFMCAAAKRSKSKYI